MAFQLFGFDFTRLFDLVKSWLGPFGKLIDQLKVTYTHTVNVYSSAQKLADSIKEEIIGWKNFKQDIRFGQRVIQLESAIQKTRDLIEGIPAAWRSILDLIKELKSQVGGESDPVGDTEAIVEDVESGGIKSLINKFPALGKALEKLLGVLAIIITALESITKAVDDIQTIVDELKRLRLEIEKLDTIFLSQSNKRKYLKLADGSTIRVRVGNLHS